MKFLAVIAASSAQFLAKNDLMSLNSRDAFGATRTAIFNEDVDFGTLPERALISRAAQNVYAPQLVRLDE